MVAAVLVHAPVSRGIGAFGAAAVGVAGVFGIAIVTHGRSPQLEAEIDERVVAVADQCDNGEQQQEDGCDRIDGDGCLEQRRTRFGLFEHGLADAGTGIGAGDDAEQEQEYVSCEYRLRLQVDEAASREAQHALENAQQFGIARESEQTQPKMTTRMV